MIAPVFHAQTLAERNEFANAPTMGALLPCDHAVPREWCATPAMRAYVIGQFCTDDRIATHETALWIHTGVATCALARELSFTHGYAQARGSHSRSIIHDRDTVRISNQRVTTPDRTAVDLLIADLQSGIDYLLQILALCPDTSVQSILDCTYSLKNRPGIIRVRDLLAHIQAAKNYPHIADTTV